MTTLKPVGHFVDFFYLASLEGWNIGCGDGSRSSTTATKGKTHTTRETEEIEENKTTAVKLFC